MIPIQIMAVLEGQIRFLLRPTDMKIQYGQTMFLKVRSSASESPPQPITHPASLCSPPLLHASSATMSR